MGYFKPLAITASPAISTRSASRKRTWMMKADAESASSTTIALALRQNMPRLLLTLIVVCEFSSLMASKN